MQARRHTCQQSLPVRRPSHRQLSTTKSIPTCCSHCSCRTKKTQRCMIRGRGVQIDRGIQLSLGGLRGLWPRQDRQTGAVTTTSCRSSRPTNWTQCARKRCSTEHSHRHRHKHRRGADQHHTLHKAVQLQDHEGQRQQRVLQPAGAGCHPQHSVLLLRVLQPAVLAAAVTAVFPKCRSLPLLATFSSCRLIKLR